MSEEAYSWCISMYVYCNGFLTLYYFAFLSGRTLFSFTHHCKHCINPRFKSEQHGCVIGSGYKGALGYQTPEVPCTSPGASQFGTVKEWCWQSEPGASSQAWSRRRGYARQPPEWQHFNINTEPCTLQGKGKTEGNVVSVFSWRGILQNYKCHYFALHLYLTDRNTHTYPNGTLVLHLLLVICKWHHVY